MRTYADSVVNKFVTETNGTAGAGALVTVYVAGSTVKAPLFDVLGVEITNPLAADDEGNYAFKVADGIYDLVINEGALSETRIDRLQIAEIVGANADTGHYSDLAIALAENLAVSTIITTAGYFATNDGGGGKYVVVSGGTGAVDGGQYLNMLNGNQLEFIGDTVNAKQYGCTTAGSETSTAMQAFLNSAIADIVVTDGEYIVQGLSLTRSVRGESMPTFKLPASAALNIFEITGDHIDITGIKFNGNGANNQTQNGPIFANVTASQYLSISECEITNFYERMVMLDTLSPFFGAYDNRIYNTDFTAQGSLRGDVFVIKSSSAVIQNNTFNNIGNGHCVRTGVFGTDPQTLVENVLIDGNSFNNTQHVGCTLEEQSKFIVISNNTFNNLEQAIKCEKSNNVVSDITITGNTITNITINTALNLSVPRVIFSSNIVTSIDDGPTFGDDFICSDNYFADSGRDTFSFLTQLSGSVGGVISGNTFKNLAYRAVGVADKVTITANTFKTMPNFAINISGSYCSITANIIDDVDRGIVLSGSSANNVASLNTISNTATTPISNSGAGNIVQSNTGADDVIFDETTISVGVITSVLKTPTQTIITNNEGGAATDDVDTISNTTQGQIVILRPNANAQLPTFIDGSGNLKLAGNADFAMTNSSNTLTLLSDGTSLLEISRSIN